jgi:hypothetical protein
LEVPAVVSHDRRSHGSRLHGNSPTASELLYFSFPGYGKSKDRHRLKRDSTFVFVFLFNCLIKKFSAIPSKIQERQCIRQMIHDQQLDEKPFTPLFPISSSSLLFWIFLWLHPSLNILGIPLLTLEFLPGTSACCVLDPV